MLNQPVSISAEELDRMTQENGSVEFSQFESTENGSRFTITWYRNLVRQSIECDLQSPESLQDLSIELKTVDSRLMQALRDASQATDDGSVRYALYCLELDGKKGTVSATDGRQLVQIGGFEFPWREEAILVRNNRLFRLADFSKLKSIQVGIFGDMFVLAADRWRFEFPIERNCRFPNLENAIPNAKSSSNRIQLSESDRLFLNDCLPELPGEDDADQPVTLDLNGHVAIVGRSRSNQRVAAAAILDRSVHLGPEMQTTVNRHYLRRALQLGADEIYLNSNQSFLARSQNMQYVCAMMESPQQQFDWNGIQQIHSSRMKRA